MPAVYAVLIRPQVICFIKQTLSFAPRCLRGMKKTSWVMFQNRHPIEMNSINSINLSTQFVDDHLVCSAPTNSAGRTNANKVVTKAKHASLLIVKRKERLGKKIEKKVRYWGKKPSTFHYDVSCRTWNVQNENLLSLFVSITSLTRWDNHDLPSYFSFDFSQ